MYYSTSWEDMCSQHVSFLMFLSSNDRIPFGKFSKVDPKNLNVLGLEHFPDPEPPFGDGRDAICPDCMVTRRGTHKICLKKYKFRDTNPKKSRFCRVLAKKNGSDEGKKCRECLQKSESCVTTPFPRCQFKRSRVFPRQVIKGNNMDSGEQKFTLKVANHSRESKPYPKRFRKYRINLPNIFCFTKINIFQLDFPRPQKFQFLSGDMVGVLRISTNSSMKITPSPHQRAHGVCLVVQKNLGIGGIQCRYDLKKNIDVFECFWRISSKFFDFWWFLLDSDMLIIFSNEFDRTNRTLKFDWQSLFRLKTNTINNS